MIVIRQNDNKDNERIVSFDPPLMGSHINSDFKHFLFENGDFQAKKIKIRPQTIGVLEIFKDNEKKVYTTSRTSCNCSFRVEHQAPCRHIIFIRSMDDESDVFSVDMFHERYHRIEFNPLSAGPVEEELTNGSLILMLKRKQSVTLISGMIQMIYTIFQTQRNLSM